MWPATEAFNRSDIAADWPTAALVPAWAADDDQLEATQADADQAAKRFWQRSSWYRRASIRNESLADQPVVDDLPTQGAVYTDEVIDAAAAGDLMARRRLEDERFAYFAEASIVFLDLPDAVFRGYEGDDELLGMPRADDDAPFELLRQEIARLEPQKVYFPLGVGGHVDHQLCREVGIRLLQEGRRWVMPGPGLRRASSRSTRTSRTPGGTTSERLDDLARRPAGRAPRPTSASSPSYADITDQLERKIMGISLYESQIERLFDGTRAMADAVRKYGRAMAELGDVDGVRRAVLGLRPRLTPMASAATPAALTRRPARRSRSSSSPAIAIRLVLLPTAGLARRPRPVRPVGPRHRRRRPRRTPTTRTSRSRR